VTIFVTVAVAFVSMTTILIFVPISEHTTLFISYKIYFTSVCLFCQEARVYKRNILWLLFPMAYYCIIATVSFLKHSIEYKFHYLSINSSLFIEPFTTTILTLVTYHHFYNEITRHPECPSQKPQIACNLIIFRSNKIKILII
jgi:hypothetical protein